MYSSFNRPIFYLHNTWQIAKNDERAFFFTYGVNTNGSVLVLYVLKCSSEISAVLDTEFLIYKNEIDMHFFLYIYVQVLSTPFNLFCVRQL